VSLEEAQALAATLSNSLAQFDLRVSFDPSTSFLDFSPACTNESSSCFFQNPSSPYGRLVSGSLLPPFLSDGQQKQQQQQQQSVKEQAEKMMKTTSTLVDSLYTINEWHGWLFFGCTPPPAKYFGIQTYVVLSNWTLIFGDIGDAVNLAGFRTEPGPLAPFSSRFLFLSTPNDAIRKAVASALEKLSPAGSSQPNGGQLMVPSVMNVEFIPSTESLGIQPLGYIPLMHPLFGTLFRFALCEADHQKECDAYLSQPTFYAYRIFQSSILRQPPIPFISHPLAYKTRGTGTTEAFLEKSFNQLLKAVQQFFERDVPLYNVSTFVGDYQDSTLCREQLLNCQGDTRDTLYMRGGLSQLEYTSGADNFGIIAGVLHAEPLVGKATYTNVASYCMERELGMAAVTGQQLAGSALGLMQAVYGSNGFNRTEAGLFYLLSIHRDCAAFTKIYPNINVPCLQIDDEKQFPGCAVKSQVFFVERSYLEKKTGIGPDPAELIAPRFLFFKRKP